MDDRGQYDYAWNERGQRFHALKSGRRKGRVNMMAALCNQKLSAPFTLEGACNRTVFEMWLETTLVPTLVTGQVVVMDNATFHKGGRIQELIKNAGCRLLYLPPYSPALNKIEKCWSWLKSRIRKLLDRCDCLPDATLECLTSYVLTALAVAISGCTTSSWQAIYLTGSSQRIGGLQRYRGACDRWSAFSTASVSGFKCRH